MDSAGRPTGRPDDRLTGRSAGRSVGRMGRGGKSLPGTIIPKPNPTPKCYFLINNLYTHKQPFQSHKGYPPLERYKTR